MNQITTRKFETLRISLTTRCNLACNYCVEPGKKLGPQKGELSMPEMARAITLLSDHLKLKKLRLTGGEPLLGGQIEELLPLLKPLNIPMHITTNGQLLEAKLAFLQEMGVQKINISLDSLDPKNYRSITKGGKLDKTLQGIHKALAMGFQLKLNMIPMRGVNDHEIMDMVDFCIENKIELRFIELMRMGHLAQNGSFDSLFVGLQEIIQAIRAKYSVTQLPKIWGETALDFQVSDAADVAGNKIGKIGIIANESQPFCQGCNRLRLSSTGDILGCLSSTESFSMLPLLRKVDTEANKALGNILRSAMKTKQQDHFTGSNLWMQSIGG